MKKLSISLFSTALSLFLVSKIMSGMVVGSVLALIILTVVLSMLNATVKPVLKLLSIPISVLTLGLFSLIINGIVLKLAFMLVAGASLSGFITMIFSAIWLSIINAIIQNVLE